MIKILITAGGTKEYIDDVRIITNISTGRLGATIAEKLQQCNDLEITYIHGEDAIIPQKISPNIVFISVKSAKDAMEAMKSIISKNEIDLVIHSMAVSDFTFSKKEDIKLKSDDKNAFIDYMRDTIEYNPKIISYIKQWDPTVTLVGFKFEVGIDHNQLMDLARGSIEKNGCDLIIANDKEEMNRIGDHVAYFVYSLEMRSALGVKGKMVIGKDDIATELFNFITLFKFKGDRNS